LAFDVSNHENSAPRHRTVHQVPRDFHVFRAGLIGKIKFFAAQKQGILRLPNRLPLVMPA
jgi:hypothetical protein